MDVNDIADTTPVEQAPALSASAVLRYPSTYRVRGRAFRKNERTVVPLQLAAYLRQLENFDVDLNGATAADIQNAVTVNRTDAVKPSDIDAVLNSIILATNSLDPDNPANFLKDGRPDARVLTKMLGYTVTSEERDEALGYDDEDRTEGSKDRYSTGKASEEKKVGAGGAPKIRIPRGEGVKL